MKRFTDTDKWSDTWFRKLSGTAKLLWIYLTDHCNSIGLVDLDFELATIDIGFQVEQKHIEELGDRIQSLGNGRLFIPKFINFQYGELSTACTPHRKILKLVADHGLERVGILYRYPTGEFNGTPSTHKKKKGKEEDQDQDQDQDREGVKGEGDIYHPQSRTVLHYLNEKSGRHFRETDTNLGFISARLSEKGVSLHGVLQMIDRQCVRWLGSEQEEYLRPETLFNKTKFDNYYAAKDAPVNRKAGQSRPVNITDIPPEALVDWRVLRDEKLAREAAET